MSGPDVASNAAIIIVIAVVAGFLIGRWYEHGRRGGVAELRWQLHTAEAELRTRRRAAIGRALAPVNDLDRRRVGR